ncbi:hypothetical protein Vadar_001019 [Vaccinium darrowii]|uniref:Uncharacterized protein n=1 Tax=Vaccinium darrowii TaxID=229202 RepID=A0ACB7YKD4_9ERIC|nr:hypothetical protein Vadar_001019 [Vaccinium darrowii]
MWDGNTGNLIMKLELHMNELKLKDIVMNLPRIVSNSNKVLISLCVCKERRTTDDRRFEREEHYRTGPRSKNNRRTQIQP